MALAILITSNRLQLFSERKVLKEEEYATMLEAEQVIVAAKSEAQRLRTEAREALQREEARGYREGWARAQAEHARQLIDRALVQQDELLAMKSAVARLVARSVAQLVAEADPERVFQQALQRVEPLLRAEPFVRVHVAEADAPALERALEVLRRQGRTLNLVVEVDTGRSAGTCTLRTASGAIEVGLNAQLDALRRSLGVSPSDDDIPAQVAVVPPMP